MPEIYETKRIAEIMARERRWIDEKYDRVLPTHPVRKMRKTYKIDAHNAHHPYGNERSRRPVIAIHWDGRERRYDSVNDAAYALGVERHVVSDCIRGRRESVCGYKIKHERRDGK